VRGAPSPDLGPRRLPALLHQQFRGYPCDEDLCPYSERPVPPRQSLAL